MSKVFAFLKDESGATAIEYGLIAAGISVVIIATVNAIGTTLNAKFDSVSTEANGSASGNASASRRSVAADVAADGNGAASFNSKQDDTQQ